MKKTLLTLVVLLTANWMLSAQNIGINTNNPDASAALDVTSTTQGMLVPRMLQSQRTLISNPATGLLVYQTDGVAGFYFYNGTAWASLNGSAGATGAQGPAGPAGPMGPAGAQGPAGATGVQGPAGPMGPAGATGATGLTGSQGPTGAMGATGSQGPAGATGAQGPAGAAGQGVPTGGAANQVLAKVDGTDFNTQWVTPTSGSGTRLILEAAGKTTGQTINVGVSVTDGTGTIRDYVKLNC